MATSLTSSMHRFASTIFVFLALLVACVGANAMPCERSSDVAFEHVALLADDILDADASDPLPLPSIEDNSGGLDDTFDVPVLPAVIISRMDAVHPGNVQPAPHAHHHSLDLRPPIA